MCAYFGVYDYGGTTYAVNSISQVDAYSTRHSAVELKEFLVSQVISE